ncbi:MAG: Na(+)-translocating NADH-quinone reductase subunit A [Bacteroidales bacterium]|nr:Na(+)-translocating NADH-quinone reductase subunit A [Bacteroidales bacterium]
MTKVVKITKGLDIPLLGEAEKIMKDLSSNHYAIKPTDFNGVFPKVLIKEGDEVKAGSPLFFNKYNEKILFTAPVSGKVIEIHRGDKRVLEEIRIEADGMNSHIDFGSADPQSLKREEIVEKLIQSGIWPCIRQRPFSVIADPYKMPKAIHVSTFDTAPLAPDYDFIIHGKGELFQTGLNALAKLTNGTVHLNVHSKLTTSKVFLNSRNVQINHFAGPHPSGNVSVHIAKTDPINKGDIVWYLNPQDVLAIGRLFQEGVYDASMVIALTGSEVLKPVYYKTLRGVSVKNLLLENLSEGPVRIISGNVLSGDKILPDGYLGFYHNQITVIPEGNFYEFIGWATPGFGKFSFSRAFFSWLNKSKKYRLDTNLHGGHRAFVMTGKYEQVFPLDILPLQLLKACMINDIDLMEGLGIYEVDEEDFALCEFIDTSKTEMQSIIRKGLDLMRKETS